MLNVYTSLQLTLAPVSTGGSDSTTPWTAAPNSTNTTFFPSTNPVLYIIPTSGSFAQVGFVDPNDTSTAPTGAVTTGFTFFGTNVAYVGNDSSIQLQFWAQETNTTDVWALMWNAAGIAEDRSIPVTLKSTPPTVLNRFL
jgi:hypothetical protein